MFETLIITTFAVTAGFLLFLGIAYIIGNIRKKR
jgi:ABC-type antimicrobial peptide transport system permease subunit